MKNWLSLFALALAVIGPQYASAQHPTPKPTAHCNPSNPSHVSATEAARRGDRNDEDTFCWDYIAAVQGSPHGEATWAYDLYTGGSEYYAEAILWAQKAQRDGRPWGAYILSLIYQDGGDGVRADPAKSKYWLNIALKDPGIRAVVDEQNHKAAMDFFDSVFGDPGKSHGHTCTMAETVRQGGLFGCDKVRP